MRKNVAGQVIGAQILDGSGDAVTTGNTSTFITGDAGTQAAGAAAVHEGNGFWSVALTQAQTNYNHVAVTFTNDAGGKPVTVQAYTGSLDPDTAYATQASLTGVSNRIPAALSNGRMDSDVRAIDQNTTSASGLAAGAREVVPFTVGASPTQTTIPTGLQGTYSTNNHFEGRVVTIGGETKGIVSYNGTTGVLTTQAFAHTISQGDAGAIT